MSNSDQDDRGRTPRGGAAGARSSRAGGRPRDPAIEHAIIQAARKRLASDGYSQMTIGDIAADAGVTRPTLYRRWATKYDLVVDALKYGLRMQREAYPAIDWDRLEPVDAFKEAVRRLDPRYNNKAAMALHGNFMAEADREPRLLEQLREHGVGPRCQELITTLHLLRKRGAVRPDIDLDIVVTMCFGSYFADYLRTGESPGADFADRIVDTVWPAIAADHRDVRTGSGAHG
ncbi:TetR/AcrR family transcriptional regulator [Actinomadura madurae]|uniref:TetR/AcrR family transcriptional regulator n=1 Tax=Actinomadura madurae TaxID=1993 RepID=UPI0020D22B45|nr:TetR/AcrR family transcriptional regulator [Actinomadura madurae]MCP9951009.1 TetR/AcrR family transcriptional regulator [Actinomadura madurae]MCP9967793.1 TetR/AcrR family transcriptional regulator [Actinomadura madurae]MCQ0008233.1 TetR/AcrR family transcriptional regulator [Actinomadura madurae]